MKIKEAVFVASSTNYHQCPAANKPEVCFVGRSNVGKSSLINMLVGRKQLAKTSATPGKTRLINHYLINQSHYLVDLPGYGWAQASKTNRLAWSKMICDYLQHRPTVVLVAVLIDIRLPPQPIDLVCIAWLTTQKIPFAILLTKADKLSTQQIQAQLATFQQTFSAQHYRPVSYCITASKKGWGKEGVLDLVAQCSEGYKQ